MSIKVLTAITFSMLIISTARSAAEMDVETKRYMPIRESLTLLYAHGARSEEPLLDITNVPAKQLDPKIRKYLLCFLDNAPPKLWRQKANAILLLGFVGESKDLDRIDSMARSFINMDKDKRSESFDEQLELYAGAWGAMVGMFEKRKLEHSRMYFDKYAKIGSWRVSDSSKVKGSDQIAENAYSWFIMMAYKYSKSKVFLPALLRKSGSKSPYLHESFVHSLQAMKTDAYTQAMELDKLPPAEVANRIKRALAIFGPQIDQLIRAADSQKPIELNRRTAKPVLRQNDSYGEKAEKMVLSRETLPAFDAIRAFESLSKTIQNDTAAGMLETMKLRESILDNGKPIGKSKWDRYVAEITRSMKVQRAIFKDVAGMKDVRYENFHIQIQADYRLKSLPKEPKPDASTKAVTVTGQEDITVSFDIPKTAAMYKKHIPRGFSKETKGKKGNLRVFMKRINGKWMWNPFSW